MTPNPQPATPAPTLEELYASGRFAETLALYRAGTSPRQGAVESALMAAIAAARTGAFEEAWQLATTTLAEVTRRHDREQQLRILNLMGGVSLEQGELDRAEVAFNNAARIALDLGESVAAAKAWNNLGILTHLRRHPLPAVELFVKALEVYDHEANLLGQAQTRYNLSLVHRDLGEFNRAAWHLEQAHAAANQTTDLGLRALVLLARAELAVLSGVLAPAAEDLAAGRQLAAEANDPLGEAEAARVEARLALCEGRFAAARFAARRGARTARAHHSRILEAECDALCALALHGLWKVEEAMEEHQDALGRLRQFGAARLAAQTEQEWRARPTG